MDDEPRLWAKAFILFFRFDEQGVSARIQIGISMECSPRVLVHSSEKPSSL